MYVNDYVCHVVTLTVTRKCVSKDGHGHYESSTDKAR